MVLIFYMNLGETNIFGEKFCMNFGEAGILNIFLTFLCLMGLLGGNMIVKSEISI